MTSRPDWRYRTLLTALTPLLIWRSNAAARRAGDERMARQRLGRDLPERHDRPVWIHMASVGEVNAAWPLVTELRERHPGIPVMVSTFTPTGAATAIQKFGREIEHVYLPLDFDQAVRSFFARIKPRCALIMETEIWPRLFYHARLNHVPLVIVNGRLSARSMNKPVWMRAVYRRALKNVDRVLARSAADARRFVELGMAPDKVQTIDNLKFAAPPAQRDSEPITLPRPYVLAASTHDDEELQLGRAWLAAGWSRDYLLVIVPRHPDRRQAILQQLRSLTAGVAARSDNDGIAADTRIYLADTFGELPGFIAAAQLVFVGGSLIPRGGQNILEVARQGKVALFGPHMENFADERDLLIEGQAAVEADNATALVAMMAELLSRPERLDDMGRRARQLVNDKADVARRYLDALAPWLS